ncbi:MarR family winged helix-turn-helix transcriptional regulator [Halalkalibaculum sp. DA3122]|uniref:MarR family winged helix-turn-helix transcriptional regulator n=1 Tax=unclassified Halalkalibaculum TaxID=2964617 RepID=UPI0037547BA2
MEFSQNRYRDCLYFTTNVLSRRLTSIAEEAFTPLGLSPSYAYLLMTVNEQPGIRPGQISRELELSPSTVTRLLDKMEHRGYLERTSAGRATEVHPTGKSLDLQPRLQQVQDELRSTIARELGERYTEVLTEMTYTAVDKLD